VIIDDALLLTHPDEVEAITHLYEYIPEDNETPIIITKIKKGTLGQILATKVQGKSTHHFVSIDFKEPIISTLETIKGKQNMNLMGWVKASNIQFED
jgi:hypothetical protein